MNLLNKFLKLGSKDKNQKLSQGLNKANKSNLKSTLKFYKHNSKRK
jgi:hypothetical protein